MGSLMRDDQLNDSLNTHLTSMRAPAASMHTPSSGMQHAVPRTRSAHACTPCTHATKIGTACGERQPAAEADAAKQPPTLRAASTAHTVLASIAAAVAASAPVLVVGSGGCELPRTSEKVSSRTSCL